MIDLKVVEGILSEAGYSVGRLSSVPDEVQTFESDTVLGFVLGYQKADALIADWENDTKRVLSAAQFALRRADAKAWNVYFVLLAEQSGDYGQTVAISAIEENLVGTRKVARAGIATGDELRAALLPLLPVQNTPRLEGVDMQAEIRLRTTELPRELIETFLSGASDATLVQLLEGSQ